VENVVGPPSAAGPVGAAAPKLVDLDAIDRELTALWNRSAAAGSHDAPAAPPEAVTRACMSNLIIFCTAPDAASGIAQEVASIVQAHPARVLLFIEDAQRPAADIEAYVAAQCFLAGGGRQICSEHVTINAGPAAARRLPSVARPLLIGDLPTALWWAAPDAPPLHGRLFDELATMADQVIYDSAAWQDAARGVVAIADWARHADAGRTIADLAWRRIKPWRRVLSESLDPLRAPGVLESLREVVIEHGPHALPEAWLLIGWLACCLGWRPAGGAARPGVDLAWTFQAPHGGVGVTVRHGDTGPADLRRVTVEWTSGVLQADVLSPGRLAATVDGRADSVRVVASPTRSRAALLARQLPALGRDPIFLDTLDIARIMARALL